MQAPAPLREAVHPRRNVEEFPPVEARLLRFTVLRTSSGQEPCLDELEVYGPAAPEKNLALASRGTVARASGTYPEYRIHALPHVHDGLYGNGHSWISDSRGAGWVELEFPTVETISRLVWSRDRERKFIDRLAVEYRVEISEGQGREWRLVASSADRQAPPEALPGLGFAFPVTGHSTTTAATATVAAPGHERPAQRGYLLRTWQTSDGLPSNTVTCLRQTADGWLWVGTTQGLARFDGQQFTVFGEAEGLNNLSITCLHEDRQETLWAGTEGGGLLRWRDGKFTVVPTGSRLAENTVLGLAENREGLLRIATAGALLELRDGKPRRVLDGAVTGLAAVAGEEDGLWLLRDNVLWHWDGQSLRTAPANLDPARFSSIGAIAGGGGGTLWFGGANGYVGLLEGEKVSVFGEGHSVLSSNIWQLLPASRGGAGRQAGKGAGPGKEFSQDLWIGTSAGGLARLRGHELLQLTTDDGLPSNCVRALCEDRGGNLWAGTAGGGLTRLRPRRVQALTTQDGLSHNAILALAEDAVGGVWIGTDGGGLNYWKDGKVEPRTPGYFLDNQSLPALALAPDGALWLGTSGSGVFRWAQNEAAPLREIGGLPGRMITALLLDSRKRIWIGTLDGGAACVNAEDGAVIPPPSALAPLAGQRITGILEDREGGLWFGSAGQGLSRLDAGGGLRQWTRASGLASDFIRTLREDDAGRVWIGSQGGLSCWSQGRFFHFTRAHGLPDTAVSQILDDGEGHLWLGTNAGVLRISLASLNAVAAGRAERLDLLALGTGDGLPSLECPGGFQPAGWRTRSGQLCFPTVAGLALIRPEDFSGVRKAPPVVIESLLGAGPDGALPLWKGGAGPVLPVGATRLEFSYTALEPGSPERVRFRHRLAGLEESWTEAGALRSAVHTHPAPGDYCFEVAASADGGPWSDPPARLALHVPAPWWRRPWALAAGSLLTVAAVAGAARSLTRRRLQRSLREVERQFALERERSRIARDIHDDLGANLTQISLLSALGQRTPEDPERVRRQFAAIAATAGELVQAMDTIVWAVNPSQDSLEGLARYLVRFAGDFFAHSAVRLRLEVPPELPRTELSSELRHNLFLAAKEALHNALHHSGASGVQLSLAVMVDGEESVSSPGIPGRAGGMLVVEIADDGCGFTPDPDKEGNGLGNMRHRLTECGGSCVIESSPPGGGTRVRLRLPLPPHCPPRHPLP